MEKNFQTQESRLDALEMQLKSLDHKLDSKFYELLADCRSKINEEKIARLDSEYETLKWFAAMLLIIAVVIFFIF